MKTIKLTLTVCLFVIASGCLVKPTASPKTTQEGAQSGPTLVEKAEPAGEIASGPVEKTDIPSLPASTEEITAAPSALPAVTETAPVEGTEPGQVTEASPPDAPADDMPTTPDAEQAAPEQAPSDKGPSTAPVTGGGTESPAGCTNRAAFEKDITIPDNTVFRQGETFTKTWRLYNAGTCAWGSGYAVIFTYGDPLGAPRSNPLPETRPGASIEVSVTMTAPSSPGQYAGNWQLQDANGDVFGVGATGHGMFWVQIMVSYFPPEGETAGETTLPASQESVTSPATSSVCFYEENPGFESEILAQINAVRSGRGLDPLAMNYSLSGAALWYSIDMACNNRVDFTRHTDTSGGRWYERILAQGYDYAKAYENVYAGNPQFGGTPQAAMTWWMNSAIHRDNILNPDVTEIGIGYAYTSTSDLGGYFTADFAVQK